MKYVFFEMALFWCCLTVPALALDPIDLGERNTLTITTDAIAKTTTVTLTNDGYLTESVILGNAGVDEAAVKAYKLCAGCSTAYFVPVYDLTSTYGASSTPLEATVKFRT